jgi:DNA excision repair protein ERCC-3
VSRFAVPENVVFEIKDRMARHGVCSLHDVTTDKSVLRLSVTEPFVRDRLAAEPKAAAFLRPCPNGFVLDKEHRGRVKQVLLALGYPVTDHAGLVPGEPLSVSMRADVFSPYPYQGAAVRAFVDSGSHGVVVLPCGAGKTVVAMLAMAELGTKTLVLTTGREAITQWRRELLAKTTLSPEAVACYDSGKKDIGPVTLTTYSMLGQKGGDGPTKHRHFDALTPHPWGLIIYDEVHLLPAPVFRLTAELQARRRLGLTATLVREDGRAGDVFALIGPKRYDVPWRELEKSGHIAEATCIELRLPLLAELELAYATADLRERPQVAAVNPLKLRAAAELVAEHEGDRVLILGTYLEGLEACARAVQAPLITGATTHAERERLYHEFRSGKIRRLALSRVGNFAIDLPEANVLIQISGTMGSRQEEAQRLGRVLRPKPGGATFYTLVTRGTVEQEHALHRQMFLTEQGYRYFIRGWSAHGDTQEDLSTEPVLH